MDELYCLNRWKESTCFIGKSNYFCHSNIFSCNNIISRPKRSLVALSGLLKGLVFIDVLSPITNLHMFHQDIPHLSTTHNNVLYSGLFFLHCGCLPTFITSKGIHFT